ncbi:hypothetical protein V500_04822 [Pseudogymnoascus sp. VKM F-4518 (FW-2643)]|nr:hypothetical protein V500_04822 [Pseudogymnoascus sp. VKM F-4518 (FW-2643)]
MAAIGLAASIIASVKNATKDIAKVLDHLKEVEDSLTKLRDLVNQAEMLEKPLKSWPTLVALSSPNGALQQCNLAMMALYANLTPVEGRRMEIIELICWPVKKNKVEQCLKDIVTQKNVFIESLNVEHIGQSLKTGHVVSQMAKVQSDESRRKIIKWLFVTDPDTNQKAARKLHEDETSEWFTEGRDYLRWKEEPNTFLWLYGLPGCGKTILCSEIIEQTRQFCSDRPTDRALAYFYFSFRDTDKQMTTNLLRSLLSQLLQQSESTSNLVRILYDSYSHTQPPTDQLLSSIKSMIDSHRNRNVFIIIDALDECPNEGGERGDLCDCLITIKEWAASNLHVLVTSRSLVELTDSLDALCTIASISIEGAAVESDIRKFIRTQLSNDRKLQKWPTEIQGEIEKALTHGAQGMFLWVACQLNSLRKCVTASDVDKVLKSLPKTLDNTYERILMSIDTEHIQIAHIALRWISHAHRPVTIEELAEAVIIDLTACPSVNPRNRIPEPSWLMEILTGLVTISRRKRDWTRDNWMVYTPNYIHCVEIAHYSVTEYLNSSRILNTPAYMFYISNESAAEDIVQKCLCYITCYSVSNRKKESQQDLKEFPLLQYASHFWHKQLLANEDAITSQTKGLVFDFLASKTSLSSWLLVYVRPASRDGT